MKINTIINSKKYTNQWSTKLSEDLFKEYLLSIGENVRKPNKIINMKLDWETDKCFYEIKARNWTTSGTAGEKVLGVPYKYSDLYKETGKELIIICVAFQEWELTYGNTRIFSSNISMEKLNLLDYYDNNLKIKFIPFSSLLN
jgi:hypothetical protein